MSAGAQAAAAVVPVAVFLAGPVGIARRLLVAKDAKDGGGSFEVVVWRQDDVPLDDTALLRVAEKVLPTVPGWSVG
ncbi:hypothetical protein ACFS5L_23210 [Streptomyces phyllanthi]|uniref:Uncharacterized protein n=1 Tax=Streptomyces phyllanthi TaxID=1803180 RepID=A0A5N8VWD8_9ACTN|nr:hypothetical protein [Streptomyces phyllanthi]MPY39581.1 hypothetical protein [Streptomyces phyllanthi]